MLNSSLRSRINSAKHLNVLVMLSGAKHLGIEQNVSLDTEPQIAGQFQFAGQILRLRLRMTRGATPQSLS